MQTGSIQQVLIVAGGSGHRMGGGTPKQFLTLAGKPVLMHTILVFRRFNPAAQVWVALPASFTETWKELCDLYRFTEPHQMITGGQTRFHTVKGSLEFIGNKGLVAIHDGVRPFVSLSTIDRCFRAAEKHGCAIPCIPVPESVREVNGEHSIGLERKKLRLIQTPQVFRLGLLKEAYCQEYNETFTDDASVFESAGHAIYLVEGNTENIKITYPIDILVGQVLFANRGNIDS